MLFEKDATFYADQIKKQEVTVTELVQRALTNIDDVDSKLNAVIHIQRDEAIEAAREFDEALIALEEDEIQQLPPFFGVPILLKDLGQDQANHPATSGAQLMDGYIPTETDYFVQQVLKGDRKSVV